MIKRSCLWSKVKIANYKVYLYKAILGSVCSFKCCLIYCVWEIQSWGLSCVWTINVNITCLKQVVGLYSRATDIERSVFIYRWKKQMKDNLKCKFLTSDTPGCERNITLLINTQVRLLCHNPRRALIHQPSSEFISIIYNNANEYLTKLKDISS